MLTVCKYIFFSKVIGYQCCNLPHSLSKACCYYIVDHLLVKSGTDVANLVKKVDHLVVKSGTDVANLMLK
jgi:hypothetical protein